MNQRPEHRNRQHRSITFRDVPQHGNLGLFEFIEGDEVDLLDFVRIGAYGLARFGPAHDRRHSEPRTGWEVVELTEHICGIDLQTDLFVGLPKGGLDFRFAFIDTSAGQSPLARVSFHVGGPAGDIETGAALFIPCDDQRDACGSKIRTSLC